MLEQIPYQALLALAVLLPLSPALSEVAIAFGLAGMVGDRMRRQRWRVRAPHVAWLFLLLGGAGVLSLINSVSLAASLRGLFKIFKAWIVFLLASEELKTEERLQGWIRALLVGASIASADGIVQWVTGFDPIYHHGMGGPLEGLRRVSGPYHHPNDFGLFLTLILPLSLAMVRVGPSWHLQGLAKITASLAIIALLLTFSRGALLGFAVACLAMSVLWRLWRWLGGFVLLGVIMLFLLPPSLKQWIRAQPSAWAVVVESSRPEESRPQIWRAAGNMMKAHPWVGVGVNTFVLNYDRYRAPGDRIGEPPYAHNHYLHMLAEIGMVGFSMFVLVLLATVRRARTAYRASRGPLQGVAVGLALGLMAFLVNGLTESALYYPRLAPLFWLGVGALFSAPFDGGTGARAA